VEKAMRTTYEEHVGSLLPLADGVLLRILEFVAAATLISLRYFRGDDLLCPATRENLKLGLDTIANGRDIYDDIVCGAPQSDYEFATMPLPWSKPLGRT
jgi:hypothetical protein